MSFNEQKQQCRAAIIQRIIFTATAAVSLSALVGCARLVESKAGSEQPAGATGL